MRQPESWATSAAPKLLSGFTGRTVIAIGTDHALAAWLGDHPDELSELVKRLNS